MITETEITQWLKTHTFYCNPMKCQMTRDQCRFNLSLPRIRDLVDIRTWNDLKYTPIGTALIRGQRRPLQCEWCEGRNEVKRLQAAV